MQLQYGILAEVAVSNLCEPFHGTKKYRRGDAGFSWKNIWLTPEMFNKKYREEFSNRSCPVFFSHVPYNNIEGIG